MRPPVNTNDRQAIKNSLIRESNRELTICEQLRRVYDSVDSIKNQKLKKEITEKLVDAFLMAKKMGERLTYYYEKYHDETGRQGENIRVQLHDGNIVKRRKERKIEE
jgi:hypothetical protein